MKEQFEIEIRESMERLHEKINNGLAPAEFLQFYHRMSPHDCGTWVYGFYMGLCCDPIWVKSEMFRFLKEQYKGN